jgi:hypothetical protein
MNQSVGPFTTKCRWICSAMVAAPTLYWWSLRYKGDAYILLILMLLALIAGLVLFANSIFCLRRYRNRRQVFISLAFAFGSVAGVLLMFHSMPRFKM